MILLPLTEPAAPKTPLSLPWTPLPWFPKVTDTLRLVPQLDFRLCCLGPAQHSCRWAKTSCNHITTAPIAFKRACAELFYFCSLHTHKTQNTVRWGRNTMNFHHISISCTNEVMTMPLMKRSNKYPLQSSYCDGWERKEPSERCHILETWPGKKAPQLTRWVKEALGPSRAFWLS